MNRSWHVLRTYTSRVRFWVLAAMLLLWLLPRSDDPLPPGDAAAVLTFTTCTGILTLGFLALHLRRQFSGPHARLMPGFAGPHLLVGAILLTVVWCVWPIALATRIFQGPPAPVAAAHALGAVAFAIILWFPRAMAPVLIAPLLLLWLTRTLIGPSAEGFVRAFVAGDLPRLYAAIVIAAVAAYPLAAWKLLSLDDRATGGDDLAAQAKTAGYAPSRWARWFVPWRDASIAGQLAPRWRGATLTWRRLPSATSLNELGMACLAIVALAIVVWLVTSNPHLAWGVMLLGAVVMLFAPLDAWRHRFGMLGAELLRPASRREFSRQMVLAMGLDFFTWTAAASAVVITSYVALLDYAGLALVAMVPQLLLLLWGLSLAVYGVGIWSLGYRYWLPTFVAMLLGAMSLAVSLGIAAMLLYVVVDGEGLHRDWVLTTIFPVVLGAIGLYLARHTYQSWQKTDLA